MENPVEYTHLKKPFTRIGDYKGEIVAIKMLNKRSIDLTRNVRKELNQVTLPVKSPKKKEKKMEYFMSSLIHTDL